MMLQQTQAPMYIGRRPIFDRSMNVWGYFLRFWVTGIGPATDAAAELRLLTDGITLALNGCEASRRLVVPISPALLLEEFEQGLARGRIVFEPTGPIPADPTAIRACMRLRRNGFGLMFSDALREPRHAVLRQLTEVVRIDLPRPVPELAAPMGGFEGHRLVSRVEDREILHYVWKLGFGNFSLFQGSFFSKPEIIAGRRVGAGQMARLRLMGELSENGFSPARLASVLESDAALTLRLLTYANSADRGLRSKVRSVQHAIAVLGETQTRTWLRLVLMTDLASTPFTDELLLLSAQRARFLERMAARASTPLPAESMHLVGLFSLLDAMLSLPLGDVLANLPVDDGIKAILSHPSNPWLALLAAQERGQWDELDLAVARLGLDPRTVALSYTEAMEWAMAVLSTGSALPSHPATPKHALPEIPDPLLEERLHR
jgi:EAL and modified HD-GYP domain-containing signal transduction protein